MNTIDLQETISHNLTRQNGILNGLLRRVPLGIALFDQKGDLLNSNETFDGMFEMGTHKILGLNQLLKGHEYRLKIIQELLYQGIEIHSFELEFEKQNGTISWFNVSVFLNKRGHSSSRQFVFVADDITKTKKAQNRLRLKEELLSTFNENISEGLFSEREDAGFTYLNKSFLELLKLDSRDPIDELSIFDFCSDQDQALELKSKLRTEGYLRSEQVQFKTNDGFTFWGQINITQSCDINGGEFYNGTITDITEQKAKDDLLKFKNKELDYANNQIDRLLYSASHDLKAPIASVEGLLHVMNLEFDDKPGLSGYIEKLRDCAQQLNQVIDGIQSYTSSTRTRLQTNEINISNLIDRVIRKVDCLDGLSDVEIEINHQANKIPFYSDEKRLSTVLSCVLSNAVQYRDGSKKSCFVKVNSQQSTEKLIIEIIDNGTGIPKSCGDKIFEMFFKASNDSQGVGLGLFIAKETLRKLEGSISIDSTYGEGTIVHIEIPNGQKGKLMARKLMLKK